MVVDYGADGIYVSHVVPNSDAPSSGLGLLDPVTGSFRQITAEKTWIVVGGGAAWGVDQDPNAAPAQASGPGAAYNRVVKLNLADGAISGWFTSPGNNVTVLGLDATSTPVIGVLAGDTFSVRVGSTQVYSARTGPANPSGPAASDAHGTWLGSSNGTVWLYQPGSQLRSAATLPFQSVLIAGTCS